MDVHVKFQWDSTDGKVSQPGDYALPYLSNCFVGEYVTFSGDSTQPPNPLPDSFYPQSPPFSAERLDNPTISGVTGSIGWFQDNFTIASPITPYSNATFTGSQIYRFHCSVCMQANEFQKLAGTFTIERSIEKTPPYNDVWQGRITSHEYTSILALH